MDSLKKISIIIGIVFLLLIGGIIYVYITFNNDITDINSKITGINSKITGINNGVIKADTLSVKQLNIRTDRNTNTIKIQADGMKEYPDDDFLTIYNTVRGNRYYTKLVNNPNDDKPFWFFSGPPEDCTIPSQPCSPTEICTNKKCVPDKTN